MQISPTLSPLTHTRMRCIFKDYIIIGIKWDFKTRHTKEELLTIMAVSSLFDSALQAVMRELPSYEPQFSYLPGAVKARLARVMARRGLLCDRNIMAVSQRES